MGIAADLTPLEILGVAIKSEIEAVRLYQSMATRVVNRDLKARLSFLAGEEEKHRRILENTYAKQFPGVPLALPALSLVPAVDPALQETAPIPELFRLAMQAEKLAEDFYAELSGLAMEQNSRMALTYLAHIEHSHYEMLRGELEMAERFPSYYNAEEFELGTEMTHFGP
jgi:rubrerythrin